MGISVSNRYNEINVIIRTEGKKQIFLLNEKGEIESLVFDIYTQSFDCEKKYNVKLFFVYTSKSNPTVEDLSFFEIGDYELTNEGFKEIELGEKKETDFLPEERNMVGITNGFRSDLRLIMNGIKLEQGYYEITAQINEKIVGLFPFNVVKK